MICGYITGLKAAAEFKCSSNISFYLYPQTLAEINELRQVRGGGGGAEWRRRRCYEQFLPDIRKTSARETFNSSSLPAADRLSSAGSAAGGLLKRFNVGVDVKVTVSLS